MNHETRSAKNMVKRHGEKLIGKRIRAPRFGGYPGGFGRIVELNPDPTAPEIAFSIQDETWKSEDCPDGIIGVFEYEVVSLWPSLPEAVLDFERQQVKAALEATAEAGQFKLTRAAHSIGVTHQALCQMLDARHRELRDELGIKPRPRRQTIFKKKVEKLRRRTASPKSADATTAPV